MPYKGMTNTTLSYNGNPVTAYANSADLQSTIAKIDVTNFGSTAKENLLEPPEWTIRLGGFHSTAVDTIFAPDAITPGTKRNASISFGNVSYSWVAAAEIGNWQIQTTPTGVTTWSAELSLSGAPARVAT